MKDEIKWSMYKEKLELSHKICTELLGKPKTHKDWSERFNIVGDINRIIIENND